MNFNQLTDSSFRYFNIDTPAIKNTPPRMVSAHGLNDVKLFPNIPNTPNIKAIMPPMASTNAKILIIEYII